MYRRRFSASAGPSPAKGDSLPRSGTAAIAASSKENAKQGVEDEKEPAAAADAAAGAANGGAVKSTRQAASPGASSASEKAGATKEGKEARVAVSVNKADVAGLAANFELSSAGG